MKGTVLLAGAPAAQRAAAAPRLQALGLCVLQASDTSLALRHLRGGAVDALILDAAAARRSRVSTGRLLLDARRRGVLVILVGGWSALHAALPNALSGALGKR